MIHRLSPDVLPIHTNNLIPRTNEATIELGGIGVCKSGYKNTLSMSSLGNIDAIATVRRSKQLYHVISPFLLVDHPPHSSRMSRQTHKVQVLFVVNPAFSDVIGDAVRKRSPHWLVSLHQASLFKAAFVSLEPLQETCSPCGQLSASAGVGVVVAGVVVAGGVGASVSRATVSISVWQEVTGTSFAWSCCASMSWGLLWSEVVLVK